MSYLAGVFGSWNPRIVCDGVNCENRVEFDIDRPSKPRCLVNRTPPAEGWETVIIGDGRVDHCPECVAPATKAET